MTGEGTEYIILLKLFKSLVNSFLKKMNASHSDECVINTISCNVLYIVCIYL